MLTYIPNMNHICPKRPVWSFKLARSDLVDFELATGGWNLAGFWPKSCRISTNLVGSIEIWPRFLHILQDLPKISLYLSRPSRYLIILAEFWVRLTGFPPEHETCDWKKERHRACRVLRFLKQSNQDSNQRYQVFTLATHCQPNHCSDLAVIKLESIELVGFFGPSGCSTTLSELTGFFFLCCGLFTTIYE